MRSFRSGSQGYESPDSHSSWDCSPLALCFGTAISKSFVVQRKTQNNNNKKSCKSQQRLKRKKNNNNKKQKNPPVAAPAELCAARPSSARPSVHELRVALGPRDDDVHPDAHGLGRRRHHEVEAVVGLHAERQRGVGALWRRAQRQCVAAGSPAPPSRPHSGDTTWQPRPGLTLAALRRWS